MPLSEQTVKKISLIGFISLAVLGALFMFFAFFLNKGTLTITARAPYVMNIGNFKNEACPADECSVVLAPGRYEITLKKEGYREATITVEVPIGGEAKESVEFDFITTLRVAGDANALGVFRTTEFTPADDMPEEGVFTEKNYLAYIARDPDTLRHTLFVRPIEGGVVGEKSVAASFIRDIKSYRLVTDIENRGKIALIDSTAGTSTLYIIDLKERTRQSLIIYPLIVDLKWLPGGDDFLFEARGQSEIGTGIFLYRADGEGTSGGAPTAGGAPAAGDGSPAPAYIPEKLDLITSLKNIVPVSGTRLVAATMQRVTGQGAGTELEGTLVVLGESEATPSAATFLSGGALTQAALMGTATLQGVEFVDYSLTSGQARLLKHAPDLGYPSQATLSETQKSAYFLIDDKVYELTFSDQAN